MPAFEALQTLRRFFAPQMTITGEIADWISPNGLMLIAGT